MKFEWFENNDTKPVDVPAKSSRLNQFQLINYTWRTDNSLSISGTKLVASYSIRKNKSHSVVVVICYIYFRKALVCALWTQSHWHTSSYSCLTWIMFSSSFAYTIQSELSKVNVQVIFYSSRSSLFKSEMLQGGLSIGHSCKMCSAVWAEPHSHLLNVARPIFTMFAWMRPTPARSRLSCIQPFLGYWYPAGCEVSSLLYSFRGDETGGKAMPSLSKCSTYGRSCRCNFERVGCMYSVWCNKWSTSLALV